MALSDQGSRSEMAYMSNMFLGPQNTNILRNLQTVVVMVLGFVSTSAECWVRRDFGSRYWNLLRIVAAWQAMRIYSFFLNLPELVNLRLQYGPVKSLHQWYFYGFIALSILHLLRVWQRDRANILWHSQSWGISWLSFLPIHDSVLYRFVEPACVLLVGWLLSPLDGPTGGWLVLAGVALFVKNNMTVGRLRDRHLDIVDAKIESKYFNEAQSGKPKQQTAGWQVMPIQDGLMLDGEPLDIRATVEQTMGTAVTTDDETGGMHA